VKVLVRGVIGCWPIKNYTFRGSVRYYHTSLGMSMWHIRRTNWSKIFSVFQTHVHPIFLFFWTILLHLLNKLKIIHVHSSPMLAKHASYFWFFQSSSVLQTVTCVSKCLIWQVTNGDSDAFVWQYCSESLSVWFVIKHMPKNIIN
jgi:hypothetical protein